MAKAAPKKEEKSAEDATPKKKGKLPLILAAAAVLVAGGGGGWYFFAKGKDGDGPQENRAKPPKPPVFVPLDNFTVNLAAGDAEQYLQVQAHLMVLDQPASDAVKLYMPQIRHRVLLLLSKKRASELATAEDKDRLAEEIRHTINNILLAAAGKAPRPLLVTRTAAPAAAPPQPAQAQPEGEQPQEDAPKPEAPAPASAPAPAPAPAPAAGGIPAAAADDPVQSVLFTSFIIQ
jgi:flagellar FliL protein